MTQQQIEGLKSDVLAILNKVDGFKYQMQGQDFRQVTNNLQYVMTTLRNMSAIQATESATPNGYNTMAAIAGPRVQYNPDGTTKVINQPVTTGEGWEDQFDQNLLMNPPCYMLPPQSITSVPVLRQAGAGFRLKGL